MPLSKIEVRKKWSPGQAQAIIEAIYMAQREALKVPENDRQIRLIEYAPELFHVPQGKSENFTLVEITLFAGRSIEAKRSLYKAIVAKLGVIGIAPSDVFIVLNEVSLENWGIRGGIPASDIDLGFKVDV